MRNHIILRNTVVPIKIEGIFLFILQFLHMSLLLLVVTPPNVFVYCSGHLLNSVFQTLLLNLHDRNSFSFSTNLLLLATDLFYQDRRKLSELKSKKAIYVYKKAPVYCQIWFACKGFLICSRYEVYRLNRLCLPTC